MLKKRYKKHNSKKQIFEPGVQPMEFICIDLIGECYPPSSKGNRYALTAVCMLTGFTFCIPIKNKTAQEVVTAWRNHILFLFGVCRKLMMDNGMEFKNELFSQVAEQLGVERKIYMPPYRPQSNGRIEGFHNFLKSCLTKHISKNREWDDVAPLSTTSYNWLPNQHSKESPFFVMLLNFDPKRVKDLGWTPEDQDVIFDPSYISDVPDKETATAVTQRSH